MKQWLFMEMLKIFKKFMLTSIMCMFQHQIQQKFIFLI